MLWTRDADRTWRKRSVEGLAEKVNLPEIGVTLALADLYDGVTFPARPRLVLGEGEEDAAPSNGEQP